MTGETSRLFGLVDDMEDRDLVNDYTFSRFLADRLSQENIETVTYFLSKGAFEAACKGKTQVVDEIFDVLDCLKLARALKFHAA